MLDGYEVLTAPDGEAALRLVDQEHPDLVILDVVLPGFDGFTVCSRVRQSSRVPILMLTAKDTVPDRVLGLDRGADDYLVKPFALDELEARVRALIRRAQLPDGEVRTFADLTVDLVTHEVRRGDRLAKLSPLQYQLISFFIQHPRQVLSREQLCEHVWGYRFDYGSNFVDVAVKKLRKALETGSRPRLIQTVRGYGYALREN